MVLVVTWLCSVRSTVPVGRSCGRACWWRSTHADALAQFVATMIGHVRSHDSTHGHGLSEFLQDSQELGMLQDFQLVLSALQVAR